MYICICNTLKEGDLQKLCKNGWPSNGEEALKKAGCQLQCGNCIDYIESFFITDMPL